MSETLCCWNCATPLDDVALPVSRHEFCPRCAEAIHCCRQCRYFDERAPEQCREDRAEPPGNKESANFCEYFTPRRGGSGGDSDAAAAARAKLDDLFR